MILDIKKISKNFGGIKALDECSLKFEKGKLIGLIGPNGSGKSTLFNVISQMINEDSGKIIFNKKNISEMKDYEVSNEGISRTFQNVRLFKNLSIKDHLAIALSKDDELKLFSKRNDDLEKINSILNLVGLDKPIETLAEDLSYGQRKLLDLAIAIANPHILLMLDEPVAGVNPKLRESIKNILLDLKKQGDTLFVIEHDMNFIMNIVDYIFVIDNGKIISHGIPSAVQKDKKVLEAYLGN